MNTNLQPFFQAMANLGLTPNQATITKLSEWVDVQPDPLVHRGNVLNDALYWTDKISQLEAEMGYQQFVGALQAANTAAGAYGRESVAMPVKANLGQPQPTQAQIDQATAAEIRRLQDENNALHTALHTQQYHERKAQVAQANHAQAEADTQATKTAVYPVSIYTGKPSRLKAQILGHSGEY